MSRESSIAARIRERVVRKKAERETVESELATLMVRKEALDLGIAEDEKLLEEAATKKPRHKKTAGQTSSAQTEE